MASYCYVESSFTHTSNARIFGHPSLPLEWIGKDQTVKPLDDRGTQLFRTDKKTLSPDIADVLQDNAAKKACLEFLTEASASASKDTPIVRQRLQVRMLELAYVEYTWSGKKYELWLDRSNGSALAPVSPMIEHVQKAERIDREKKKKVRNQTIWIAVFLVLTMAILAYVTRDSLPQSPKLTTTVSARAGGQRQPAVDTAVVKREAEAKLANDQAKSQKEKQDAQILDAQRKGIVSPLAVQVLPLLDVIQNGIKYGRDDEVAEAVRQIEALPKPAPVDLQAARQLNEKGILAADQKDYAVAIDRFSQAEAANPSDPVIANMLAVALLDAGRLPEATLAIFRSLALAPTRSGTWATFGLINAAKGDTNTGGAHLIFGYYFAKNRQNYLETLQSLERTDPDLRIREAARKALGSSYVKANPPQIVE